MKMNEKYTVLVAASTDLIRVKAGIGPRTSDLKAAVGENRNGMCSHSGITLSQLCDACCSNQTPFIFKTISGNTFTTV